MNELEIWAQHGGLIGLIIFSLFGLVITFIAVITRKDKSNQNFIREILESDRDDRREDRIEHRHTFDKLGSAIDSLTDELRKR